MMARKNVRLRLAVRRHCLPDTQILFNIPLEEEPTVAKLLELVNETIPLESTHWGLEDYVVELRDDEGGAFEALHFQAVATIFQPDDHVFIRPLLSQDRKKRRLSGRHQISAEGVHLVDGVPFGRNPLRKLDRPPVDIPPYKRRRLGNEERGSDEHEDRDEPLLLTQHGESSVDVIDNDDDDEEDDGDFEAGTEPSEVDEEDNKSADESDDESHLAEDASDMDVDLEELMSLRADAGELMVPTEGPDNEVLPPLPPQSPEAVAENLAVLDLITTLRVAFPSVDMDELDSVLESCSFTARKVYQKLKKTHHSSMSYGDVKRYYKSIRAPIPDRGQIEQPGPYATNMAGDREIEAAKRAGSPVRRAELVRFREDSLLGRSGVEEYSASGGVVLFEYPYARRPQSSAARIERATPLAPSTVKQASAPSIQTGIRYHTSESELDAAYYAPLPPSDDAAGTSSSESDNEGDSDNPTDGEVRPKAASGLSLPVSDDSTYASSDDDSDASSDNGDEDFFASNFPDIVDAAPPAPTADPQPSGAADFVSLGDSDDGDSEDDSSSSSGSSSNNSSGNESADGGKPTDQEGGVANRRGDTVADETDDSDDDSSFESSSEDDSDDSDESSSDEEPEEMSFKETLGLSSPGPRLDSAQATQPLAETVRAPSPVPPPTSDVSSATQKEPTGIPPPSQGKSQTRKRNARRRAAQKATKASQVEEALQARKKALLDALANQEPQAGHSIVPSEEGLAHVGIDTAIATQDDLVNASNSLPQALGPATTAPNDGALTPDELTTGESPSSSNPEREMRLDVGASRRMLFASLGIKNSKNQKDEERIRSDSMDGVRSLPNHRLSDVEEQQQQREEVAQEVVQNAPLAEDGDEDEDPDAWRDKINYSAVECVQEGIELSEPPFPFVQRWDPQQQFRSHVGRGGRGKRKMRDRPDFYDNGDSQGSSLSVKRLKFADQHNTSQLSYQDDSFYDDSYQVYGKSGDVDVLNYDDEPVGSGGGDDDDGADRRVKRSDGLNWPSVGDTSQLTDLDDLPSLPADLETLAKLRPGDVKPGMVITWKQWLLSESTGWQPQLADLTAVVVGASDDSTELRVVLAKRDRDRDHDEKVYDEATGKRIYGRFEAPDPDDDEYGVDDEEQRAFEEGYRTISFADFIDPKILQQPLVLNVAGSSQAQGQGDGGDEGVVPDSQFPIPVPGDVNGAHNTQEPSSPFSFGLSPGQQQHRLSRTGSNSNSRGGTEADGDTFIPDSNENPNPSTNSNSAQPAQVTSPLIPLSDDHGRITSFPPTSDGALDSQLGFEVTASGAVAGIATAITEDDITKLLPPKSALSSANALPGPDLGDNPTALSKSGRRSTVDALAAAPDQGSSHHNPSQTMNAGSPRPASAESDIQQGDSLPLPTLPAHNPGEGESGEVVYPKLDVPSSSVGSVSVRSGRQPDTDFAGIEIDFGTESLSNLDYTGDDDEHGGDGDGDANGDVNGGGHEEGEQTTPRASQLNLPQTPSKSTSNRSAESEADVGNVLVDPSSGASSLPSIDTIWHTCSTSRQTQSQTPSKSNVLSASQRSRKSEVAKDLEYEVAMKKLDDGDEDDDDDDDDYDAQPKEDNKPLVDSVEDSSQTRKPLFKKPNLNGAANISTKPKAKAASPAIKIKNSPSFSPPAPSATTKRAAAAPIKQEPLSQSQSQGRSVDGFGKTTSPRALSRRRSPRTTRTTTTTAKVTNPKYAPPPGAEVISIILSSPEPEYVENYADDDIDDDYQLRCAGRRRGRGPVPVNAAAGVGGGGVGFSGWTVRSSTAGMVLRAAGVRAASVSASGAGAGAVASTGMGSRPATRAGAGRASSAAPRVLAASSQSQNQNQSQRQRQVAAGVVEDEDEPPSAGLRSKNRSPKAVRKTSLKG